MKASIFFCFFVSSIFSSAIYAQVNTNDTLKSRLSLENEQLKESLTTLKTEFDSLKVLFEQDSAKTTRLDQEVQVLRKIMRQYVGIIDSLNTRISEISSHLTPDEKEDNNKKAESEWREKRNELGEDPPLYFGAPHQTEPYPDEVSAFDKGGNVIDESMKRAFREPFEQGNISVPKDCLVELTVFADEEGNINRVRHIAAGTTTDDLELIKAIVSRVRENVKYVPMKLGEGISARHAILIRLTADKN